MQAVKTLAMLKVEGRDEDSEGEKEKEKDGVSRERKRGRTNVTGTIGKEFLAESLQG